MTTKEELRALDAQIAEIQGYRRIDGPRHDYDGPVEGGPVLIPPTMTDDHAFRGMPPRGSIPLTYFVRKYSSDESEALYLLRWMHQQIPMDRAHWYNYATIVYTGQHTQVVVSFDFDHHRDVEWYEHPDRFPFAARGDTLAEAICRAIIKTRAAHAAIRPAGTGEGTNADI